VGRTRRAADDSMNLEIPLKIKLMPTRVPITQTELDGQRRHIRYPRMSVTIPSNKTHPAFAADVEIQDNLHKPFDHEKDSEKKCERDDAK